MSSSAQQSDPAARARHDRDRVATEPVSEASVAELVGSLTDQFTTLVRQEVELAKAETKQELSTAARAGGAVGAAAVTGWFAVLFISLALAWGLAEVMAAGLAFLIVGVVYAVVAAVLAATARKKAEDLDPSLPKTQDSLRTTAQWAKDKP